MSFWFDPMVQTVGMPGYGGGPQTNTNYGAQLDAQRAYVGAQNQAALAAARPTPYGYGFVGGYPSFGPAARPGTYSPGSGLSSFSGVSLGGGYPSGQVTRGADLPQPDLGGYDPLGGDGGGGMVMHNDGQWRPSTGGGIGSDAAASSSARNAGYAQQYRMPQANPSYFNPATYAGAHGNYGIPFNGRPMAGDLGYSKPPSYPNLGYNPGMSNWFANPGMSGGAFQNRFGMGFPNAGTPSQYAPGARMPPGFSQPYSFDNPGGALPILNNQTTGGGGA